MSAKTQIIEVPLTLRLSDRAKAKLTEQAAQEGKDIATIASNLIEQATARETVDELLAPLRKEFADSGATDEQLIEQINEARDEYHNSRRKASA